MTTHSIVFIDSRVADLQTLVVGLGAGTAWVMLDADQDGLLQMQATLANKLDLESIRIFAHGRPGAVLLGSSEVSQETIDEHALALSAIGQSLGESGDVQIYACEVGQGAPGRAFVSALSRAVGAHLATSSLLIGHGDQGGQWQLDVGQAISAPLTLPEWHGVLSLSSTPQTMSFPGHSTGEFRNSAAFAALRADGSVVTWGDSTWGGNSSAVATQLDGTIDVTQVFSGYGTFAALRADGSVVTWGYSDYGGDNGAVATKLDGTIDVTQVFSSQGAFAALRTDGSVVTWGSSGFGGDSTAVTAKLDGTIDVTKIFSSASAFAALRADGSVITWGFGSTGGNNTAVAAKLDGTIDVAEVFSSQEAFAALRTDGSVVTWGSDTAGGNSTAVTAKLDGTIDVTKIFSTGYAFAALRADGSVVAWGNDIFGANSTVIASKIDGTIDVTQVFSNYYAFAALRTDGSVVTWGNDTFGANSSAIASEIDGTNDVTQVCSTHSAFAALRADGSVVTWGDSDNGGNITAVASKLDGTINVIQLFSTKGAFAALRADGSVVTWGRSSYGGDSSALAAELDGTIDAIHVYSCDDSFAVLRADGSVVTWPRNPGDVASQLTNVVSMANPYTSDVYRAVSVINGTPGNDPAIIGGSSGEELYGFAGNDTLDGQAGNDSMFGGVGNDTYWVRQAGDIVTEKLNEGTDIAYSYLSAYTLTSNVENGRILANGTANLTGNSVNNTLYAGLGNNVLTGGGGSDTVSYLYGVTGATGVTVSLVAGAQATVGSGSDTLSGIVNLTGSNNADHLTGSILANVLNGGAGIDILNGGLGNDTYYLDSASDQVIESTSAALLGGTDTVILGSAITSYTLGSNVDNGRITSTGAANLTGNSLNNVLYAGAGNNVITGGGGTDTLSYLYGVTGAMGVTVSLAAGGIQATVGSGLDTVSGIKNLIGSAYADRLTGNVLANALDGGIGADTLTGSDGSDIYYVRDAGDVVIETNAVAATGGTDLVYSYLGAYTLTTNVENAQIINSGSAKLTGNTGNNSLTGGSANDTLEGGIGNDTLNGGVGHDSMYGGAGDDVFLYNPANDLLDRFDGGAGFDVIRINQSMRTTDITSLLLGGMSNRDSIEAIQFSDGVLRLETDYSTNYKLNQIDFTSSPYLSGLSTKYQIDHQNSSSPLVFKYYFAESGWTESEKSSVKDAFKTFEGYISVDFLEGDLASADLVLNKVNNAFYSLNSTSTSPPLAEALFPGWAAESSNPQLNIERIANFNSDYQGWNANALIPGAEVFHAIIHEFGHALGLAHPHDDGFGSTIFPGVTSVSDLGDDAMNQGIWTMMGYNEGWDSKFPDWRDGRAYGYEATPMALDIKVLQAKYGARVETPDTNGSYNDIFTLPLSDTAGIANFKCIYDTLGVDQISALGSMLNVVIDLRQAEITGAHAGGYVSYAEGIHGGLTIANGAVIEQALGGLKNDHLIGNSANNLLDGRSGTDTMEGGLGNDTYVVYESSDIVMENTNEGIDLIQSWVTYSLYDTDGLLSLKGGNVENLRLMGAAASSINGTGNALSNVIYASAGSNVIDGAGGIDTVSYAYGLIGTSGVMVSLNNPSAQATVGSGSDRLVSIENLTGSAYADTLTGNGSANVLTGGGGKDALTGGAGNDIFDFNALTEMSTISTTWDVITDFVRGQDKIDLSTLDANTATTTNDAFSGTLVTAFTAAGQLKLLAGVLYGNTDANIATAEFAIQLTGVSSISAADFVL